MKYPIYPNWDSIKSELTIIDLLELIDSSIEEDDINDKIADYIELNYEPLYYEEDDEDYDRWREEQ